MSTVRLVDDTTAAGNRVVRSVDVNDIAAASAILLVDGRWIVSTYSISTPVGLLETRSESDAREWVQWIGEQMVASSTKGLT